MFLLLFGVMVPYWQQRCAQRSYSSLTSRCGTIFSQNLRSERRKRNLSILFFFQQAIFKYNRKITRRNNGRVTNCLELRSTGWIYVRKILIQTKLSREMYEHSNESNKMRYFSNCKIKSYRSVYFHFISPFFYNSVDDPFIIDFEPKITSI